ncbi:Poly-beta-1,6-N-acetyl-D-glucosamine synthase [bioreactor metagenome]|uniref:Poly-beta-1,6-N-acetyl-D-glucosamine synthase n=1 Tax=bioreactor metagenome TaxID=1076179 RepID=A0A645BP33_9ZZZZ
MSMIWIIGGLLFYLTKERRPLPQLDEYPPMSILIPCYNEEATISEVIEQLDKLNYETYEIIAINDGSKDHTLEVLRELSVKYDRLRVIDIKHNAGKANALYQGLVASKYEILVTVDADSFLDKDALLYFAPHFKAEHFGERVGAVTGNPRVRNRSSLLAKIQLCEYSSIISLIKRTQRILGKVMTVSGVVAAFRKTALLDCGLWDKDLITDDIGVSWKLQRRFWDVRYEPRALCWMLVPETITGLIKQRIRWAQGGIEVMFRHYRVLFDWKSRRIIPVFLEELCSIIWAVLWIGIMIYTLYTIIFTRTVYTPLSWGGFFLATICIIQFFVAMYLDRDYDHQFIKYYFWAVWYPLFYWYFNALIIMIALPKAIMSYGRHEHAVWVSPDRGL